MPNLIHSLDAASLALLFKKYHNREGSYNSIYTVHDCFAVTANNVECLVDTMKCIYILIYSAADYLIRFDHNIKTFIKMNYPDIDLDGGRIKLDNINLDLEYPNIKLVIGTELDIKNYVSGSCYAIS